MRLDVALKHWRLVPSRAKAQELIDQGEVEILTPTGQWQIADSAHLIVDPEAQDRVRLRSQKVLQYVSRGGLKLEYGIKRLNLSLQGAKALDVGISTGGFTDCLLQHGAEAVVGVDVGHGQLHQKLRADQRVVLIEGVNARELSHHEAMTAFRSTGFDLCVIDVSFISLTLVLAEVVEFLRPGGMLLALVKPQFEVGAGNLNKKGVVQSEPRFIEVERKIKQYVLDLGLRVWDYFPVPIKGQDGNQEFFIFASADEKP